MTSPSPSPRPVGPGPEGLSIDMSVLITYLGELHARQLSEANVEAAKWRAAATGAAAELAAVRARVTALEQAQPAAHEQPQHAAPEPDDMIGTVE
jgi:hypothetical protein